MAKICSCCKLELTLDNFYKNQAKKSGYDAYCKSCRKRAVIKSQNKNREKYLGRRHRAYERRMQDKDYVIRLRRKEHDASRRLKNEFLNAYGNKCICCGETNPEFLTLEHINQTGAAQRKISKVSGVNLYRHLRDRGWPKNGYTILCFNCNLGTARGNLCPHKRKQRENLSVLESSLVDSTSLI